MRGRKPTPTAIKKARGNPGRRPINKREPKPRRKLPRAPFILSDVAREHWRKLAPILYDMGVLTVADLDMLAAYCEAYARRQHALEMVAKSEQVIKTASGNLIQNPFLGIANHAMDQMLKIAAEFGMTPSSRSRLVSGAAQSADPFEAYLATVHVAEVLGE